MKGGSMTAILLDIIFMTALSRAFNVSIHKLLSSTRQEEGPNNTLLLQEPSTTTNDETIAVHSSNGSSSDKSVSSLSRGQLEVATIVDAFAATYNAAYRSALVSIIVCMLTP